MYNYFITPANLRDVLRRSTLREFHERAPVPAPQPSQRGSTAGYHPWQVLGIQGKQGLHDDQGNAVVIL